MHLSPDSQIILSILGGCGLFAIILCIHLWFNNHYKSLYERERDLHRIAREAHERDSRIHRSQAEGLMDAHFEIGKLKEKNALLAEETRTHRQNALELGKSGGDLIASIMDYFDGTIGRERLSEDVIKAIHARDAVHNRIIKNNKTNG